MTETVLELNNLSVTYGKKDRKTYAVQDVSLSLKKGEALGVVGESGCGKTTVAMALMGLLDSRTEVTGEMVLLGKKYDLSKMSYNDWRPIRGSKIAMVFQDSLAALNPLKKIGEQIAEAIYVKKQKSKKQAREQALKLLKLVEIPDPARRFNQYPHECSGGMRQRAMIAMALSNNPDVLICDEPTTALDVTVQAQILALIKKLQNEIGMAVILVTHDLGVVNAVTDDIAVMYASSIIETGSTPETIAKQYHPYTCDLLHAMPDIAAPKGDLHSIPGVPPTLNREFTWCPYGPRCKYHDDKCDEQMPDLIELSTGRFCACVHPLNISQKEVANG
ncbi:MAG: ABC transporter ATP-binding protein [Acidimicrobiia bacterium]